MHSTIIQGFTGTQKSVYRDSTGSKLEEASLLRTMQIPHYQRFDSNSETGFSIAVYNLPATTFKQGIVASTMPFTHSTAVSAPFTCMVGVNSCESDVLVEASGFEVGLEKQDGHPQDFFIESSAFGLESFEVFNSNVSIIFEGKICNFSNDFTYSILDKVLFFSPKPSQRLNSFLASFISEALEFLTPEHNTLSFCPDVFAEVELLENLAFGCKNADSITLTVDINSYYILSSGYPLFRTVKESDNLPITSQSISFTYPSSINQGFIPLPVTVFPDGNTDRILGVETQSHKILSEREGLSTSGNIELDSDAFEVMPFGFDNTTLNITDNLTIKGGAQFGS